MKKTQNPVCGISEDLWIQTCHQTHQREKTAVAKSRRSLGFCSEGFIRWLDSTWCVPSRCSPSSALSPRPAWCFFVSSVSKKPEVQNSHYSSKTRVFGVFFSLSKRLGKGARKDHNLRLCFGTVKTFSELRCSGVSALRSFLCVSVSLVQVLQEEAQ